jgi:hypothetical protein
MKVGDAKVGGRQYTTRPEPEFLQEVRSQPISCRSCRLQQEPVAWNMAVSHQTHGMAGTTSRS